MSSSNNPTKAYWMELTRELFFTNPSIDKVCISQKDFNLLFLGALCLPFKKDYLNKEIYKPELDLHEGQKQLITSFLNKSGTAADSLKEYHCIPLKSIIANYTTALVQDSLKQDGVGYCAKSSNPTSTRYIAYFEECTDWQDPRVLQLIELYSTVLKVIFISHLDILRNGIDRLRAKCCNNYNNMFHDRHPKTLDKPSFLEIRDLGDQELYDIGAKLLTFSLLYYAENDKNNSFTKTLQLCGFHVTSDNCTKSKDTMKVPAQLFYEICIEALKSDMWTFEKLQALDEVLQKHAENDIPPELVSLIIKKCRELNTLLFVQGTYDCSTELIKIHNRYTKYARDSINIVKTD